MFPLNNSLTLPHTLESQTVFKESLITIKKDLLQVDQNSPYPYYSLSTRPLAVAILAMTPEGEYVLNQEYRHPTGQVLLSCPGGFIDNGEDALQAAKRELLEETGFEASSFEIIGNAFPFPGLSAQKTIFVRAKEAVWHQQTKLEKSEIILIQLLKPENIKQLILNGTQVDASLCAALFFNQIFLTS